MAPADAVREHLSTGHAPLIVSPYRVGSAVARGLPGPLASLTTRVAGVGASGAMRERRLMVERNLQRVRGPDFGGLALRRAVNRTFESYARYWMESFRLPGTSPEALDAGMSLEGYHHIREALAGDVGPVLALPHLGGWEWAAFWLCAVEEIEITAVVEALDPPEDFEWFLEFRRSLGLNVVPLGPDAGTAVLQAVKERQMAVLLCDRDIGGGGVEVEFFGETTTLPSGPAVVALRTAAPLIPAAVYFRGDLHHGVVRDPVPAERRGRFRDDVARVTQALAHELEALIRIEPEQWHLMQPNWPSDHEALAEASR